MYKTEKKMKDNISIKIINLQEWMGKCLESCAVQDIGCHWGRWSSSIFIKVVITN